jgi:hypothetical protein
VKIGSFASDDGPSGAVEMDCEHVLAGGWKFSFPQALLAEMSNGLLTRVRAKA